MYPQEKKSTVCNQILSETNQPEDISSVKLYLSRNYTTLLPFRKSVDVNNDNIFHNFKAVLVICVISLTLSMTVHRWWSFGPGRYLYILLVCLWNKMNLKSVVAFSSTVAVIVICHDWDTSISDNIILLVP